MHFKKCQTGKTTTSVLTVLSLTLSMIASGCFLLNRGGGDDGSLFIYASAPAEPAGKAYVNVYQSSYDPAELSGDKFKQYESGYYHSPFNVKGIEEDSTVIFQVWGSAELPLQQSVSFPFNYRKPVVLGGIDYDLYNTVKQNILVYHHVSTDPSLAVIMGNLNPLNAGIDICGPVIDDVILTDKSTGQVASGAYSRFSFSSTGNVGIAPPLSDGYIFVNVPQGTYSLKYSTIATTGYAYEHDVVAFAGLISYGFQIPCQEFDGFENIP